MSFATIGTIATIASSVVGIAGTAYSLSGAGTPSAPNLASSSRKVAINNAQLLPYQRGIQAAATTGGKYTFTPPKGWDEGNIPWMIKSGLPTTKNKDGSITIDFKGVGAGDTQATLAKQNAASTLDLAKKYDHQFIDAALEQEKQANPQGQAARMQEDALIQHLINSDPTSPVATELQNQVGSQVNAGSGLDAFDQEALNHAVGDALRDRSGGSGQGQDWAGQLTTGAGGESRRLAGIQKGESLLSSGITPADVQYRHEQQNLANLSHRIAGQTPTTEFGSLSAAQTGPTPNAKAPNLPLVQNSLGQAAQGAAQQYANQVNAPNPWMTGLSTAVTGLNTVANIAGK